MNVIRKYFECAIVKILKGAIYCINFASEFRYSDMAKGKYNTLYSRQGMIVDIVGFF